MNQDHAIESFTALAQESRLAIFRLLVREEPSGLPVGEISRRLNIVPSTLSGHLGVLKRAGLLRSTRHQREIHYAANLDAMGNLIRFMLEDCCDGQVNNCNEIFSLIPQGEGAQIS
jgi:DNA-binding transcriptional ArsR family regulator